MAVFIFVVIFQSYKILSNITVLQQVISNFTGFYQV